MTLTQGGILAALFLITGYAAMTQTKQPRGIRNNNPLNLESNHIQWRGKIGDDGRFVIFVDAKHGIRAGANDIKNDYVKKGKTTIRQLIEEFAPDSDNDTAAYIAHIAQDVGISPDDTITSLEQLTVMIDTMIQHENGQNPYSKQFIADAVALGALHGRPLPEWFDKTQVVNYGLA